MDGIHFQEATIGEDLAGVFTIVHVASCCSKNLSLSFHFCLPSLIPDPGRLQPCHRMLCVPQRAAEELHNKLDGRHPPASSDDGKVICQNVYLKKPQIDTPAVLLSLANFSLYE